MRDGSAAAESEMFPPAAAFFSLKGSRGREGCRKEMKEEVYFGECRIWDWRRVDRKSVG